MFTIVVTDKRTDERMDRLRTQCTHLPVWPAGGTTTWKQIRYTLSAIHLFSKYCAKEVQQQVNEQMDK